MTMLRAALLIPLCALLTACGDAGGMTPAGDGGAAQDGAAGAGAAWCGRHPEAVSITVTCPLVWPPAGRTTAVPSVGCNAVGAPNNLDTLESCIDPGIGWTPAQSALLASCDPRTFPPQPCAPTVAADGGVCVTSVTSAAYVRAVALEVIRTGRCW